MLDARRSSETQSVVILASTETDMSGLFGTVASILPPFPGDIHVVRAGPPLPRSRSGPEQDGEPQAGQGAPVDRVGRELRVDPSRVVTHAGLEKPERAVLDAVRASEPAAVILGPLSREPAPWRSSNKLARGVIGKTSAPLILLRREHEHSPRRIVVATDFSPHADRAHDLATTWALAWAMEAALGDSQATPVEVELLHISDFARPDGGTPHGLAALQKRLAKQMPRASPHVLLSSRMLSATLVPDGIWAAVEGSPPDLLFLGTHGHGPLGRALFGSVAREVLDRVECSVVVVPLPR